MDSQEPTPDEIAELFDLDKDIAALSVRMFAELKDGRDLSGVPCPATRNPPKPGPRGRPTRRLTVAFLPDLFSVSQSGVGLAPLFGPGLRHFNQTKGASEWTPLLYPLISGLRP